MLSVMAIIYIVFGFLMAATGVMFVIMIAGKDIMFAFKRFFNKKGCFVFIINSARFAGLSFLTPKENSFRINNNIYATNPKKCINLETKYITDKEKEKIKKKLEEKEARILKRIDWLKQKREQRIGRFNLAALADEQRIELLKSVAPIEAEIKRLNSLLKDIDKSENYYYKSRPAFFFIEGDPVPKDFFELYSEFDSKIIDNLAARAASSAANITGQKNLDLMKWLAIAAAIAAGIAAFLAFRNQTILNELAANAGVVISI